VDWPALVEGIFAAARESAWHRFIVAGIGGLLSVLAVAAVSSLRRWWTERSAKRQGAARALRDQGEYHAQLKHRHEALELFDLSIELNPREGQVYYLRGCLHAELGDPNRAVADWRRCLARLPRHRDAHRRLSETGQHAQAAMPRAAFLWGAVAVLLFFTLVGISTR
jgi:tetratricopeptide (TPR) repeat protein